MPASSKSRVCSRIFCNASTELLESLEFSDKLLWLVAQRRSVFPSKTYSAGDDFTPLVPFVLYLIPCLTSSSQWYHCWKNAAVSLIYPFAAWYLARSICESSFSFIFRNHQIWAKRNFGQWRCLHPLIMAVIEDVKMKWIECFEVES